jgi:hypothetical protein
MARLLAETGRTAHFQAKPADEVISLCRRAIEMAEHLGELEARADAAVTLALATPDNSERLKLLQEVAAYSEANGLWSQAAQAYHNLLLYVVGSSENAVKYSPSSFVEVLGAYD